MEKQLLSWQTSCLEAWESSGFRGIANVVTGAGKTILAVAAIKRLFEVVGSDTKIKIVVPKNFLMYQWHLALREELNIQREEIGFFSGVHKSKPNKKIMIYVINSARNVLARHIVEDAKNGNKVFLIADECHHYGSNVNARIFGYVPFLPNKFIVYTLGLSATPWCVNYNEVLVPALGDEIYRFGFLAALNAGIISKFTLFNIEVPFEQPERMAYDQLTNQLSIALNNLNKLYPSISSKSSHLFFSALEDIIKNGDPEAADLAKTAFLITLQRKEVIYHASNRINAVLELVRRIPKSSKIIIFGERIETADEINKLLCKTYHNEVGLYHSQVPKPLAIEALRRFENGDIRILITCKTLDEGLNIAETNVGIVVSSTGSRRQRVQRLGRVLRKKSGGNPAYFYYLYIGDTAEENELLKEINRREYDRLINRIDLKFNVESGSFINNRYVELEDAGVQSMLANGNTDDEIVEFLRNADKGSLTEDWLMSEELCIEKLNAASEKKERNYYISMLLLIRCNSFNKLN